VLPQCNHKFHADCIVRFANRDRAEISPHQHLIYMRPTRAIILYCSTFVASVVRPPERLEHTQSQLTDYATSFSSWLLSS
jgi:hypothetical protein